MYSERVRAFCKNGGVGFGVFIAVLAGGADEELTGAAWLNVERHGVCPELSGRS